jgi:hypothetical protein
MTDKFPDRAEFALAGILLCLALASCAPIPRDALASDLMRELISQPNTLFHQFKLVNNI